MLQRFLADESARKRYWARSLVGWQRMRGAQPNDAHRALANLERQERIELLVTQNVDGLHQAAGSRDVVDLHGRIDVVRCLSCDARLPRETVQAELLRRNPPFADLEALAAPDGDADLENLSFEAFDVPACARCGGMLKPDVVFFGEGVPKPRVDQAMAALHRADAMLVVGSSLMVYSGYRFAVAMAERGKPIAAINLGRTRADDLLAFKVTERCADALQLAMKRYTASMRSSIPRPVQAPR
jgi:NAD-dependent SIR2 family protein deacetylase